jgi:hypothetical protein
MPTVLIMPKRGGTAIAKKKGWGAAIRPWSRKDEEERGNVYLLE